ncbi:DUF6351 family protein [Microbacterium sp. CFH 31415]|uniref:DUF6351 family protein n=1 Tax=Microbacterium sp. CFH 31415 TaxID=2921732 RepID=UPI001F144218|nr:DUF6351 family protein [Microbacterium sp. CFH 31415]MCH6231487.1 DUF6351 family protein [Microbacterium sp. CFH 31415]
MNRFRRNVLALGVSAAAGALIAGLLVPVAAAAAPRVSIDVLSGRADSVTGGDALIAVAGAKPDDRIFAAGVEVTDAFQPLDGARVGLVDGLPIGVSEIQVVRKHGGKVQASIEIENHPVTGPVFSGPQHPMYCTASAAPWNLGAVDEDCHVAVPVVTYRYRTTAGQFADYPVDGSTPGNLATTTVDGATVPYIVRIERGTINRAVYETAVLHAPGTADPTPGAAGPGWNGKLAYTFGGACGVGYWQGTSTGGVQNDLFLSRGYAVASATLNVYAQNCNDVTSAETAMMVKEHVIEQLGRVEYTIGSGGSAGTMQQLLLSNNYPGIIDGVLGEIGYPDERSTTIGGHDCRGLLNYWNSPAGAGWTDAQKVAVTGHAVPGTCFGFTFFDGVDDPNRGCAAAIPVADRWSPTNPDGLRCTIADMVKNVYGTDAEGRGLRVEPDNVGVQYGWNALQSGAITAEQFVSLNERIGGMGIDGNRTVERSEASIEAIERAYATGRVNMMTGGLGWTPVIEIRNYTDPTGDFHERYRSAIIRERMLAAYGDAGTHVNWTGANIGANTNQMRVQALDKLEQWLDAIQAAGGPEDRARTIAARPADLTDGCFDSQMAFIEETLDYDDPTSTCNTLYPYHSQPRAEAGMPLIADGLKCQLTEPARTDYPELSDAQWARLLATFPAGVCDWDERPQGYAELEGTWLDFGDTDPADVSIPKITGSARVGSPLTASAASSTAGATLSYQWLADAAVIDGATGATFTPGIELVGATISVRVTAAAEGFVAVSRVSGGTARVALATVPVIEGAPVVGARLKAVTGDWTPGARLTYQWFADGKPLRGETKATLQVRATMIGDRIAVQVTGSLRGYQTVSSTSEPTLKAALATPPLVIGSPVVGAKLIALPLLWTPGTSFTYQWLRDGEPIAAATEQTYRLTRDDRRTEITVAVTGTKEGYPSVTLESRHGVKVR